MYTRHMLGLGTCAHDISHLRILCKFDHKIKGFGFIVNKKYVLSPKNNKMIDI